MTEKTTAMDLIRRAAHAIESVVTDRAREVDLTLRQIDVLLIIREHPGLSSVGILKHSTIDRSTLSKVVRLMQSKRLITRKRPREDGRAYQNFLTEKGLKAADDAVRIRARVESDVEGIVGAEKTFSLKLAAITARREAGQW